MRTYDISGFQECGRIQSQTNPNNIRIVCNTRQGEVLAIWGTLNQNTKNIEKVEAAAGSKGFPFQIECAINTKAPPQDFQDDYGHGHGHWIYETNRVDIIELE